MEALYRARRCMRAPQAAYRTPNRIGISHHTLRPSLRVCDEFEMSPSVQLQIEENSSNSQKDSIVIVGN